MSDVDLGIWSKLTKVVGFLILIAIVLGVAIWYLPNIQQNERMRKHIQAQDAQIQQLQEQLKQVKTAIDAMSNDPKAIERVARDRFGYSKPGETIARFEDNTNAPGAR
jgi:cell division protein FtsB